MARFLLDTNHLGEAVRRDPALRERIAERDAAGDRFGTIIPRPR